jgi:hypothetical protein
MNPTRHALLSLLLASPAAAQCSWLPGHSFSTSPLNGNIPALITWDPEGPTPPLLAVSSSFPQPAAPPVKLGFFDGTTWTTPPAGPRIQPAAFAVYNNKLIVGGFANSPTSPTIASWDGQEWQTLGTGLDAPVRALAVHNGDLYAGGEFFIAGGVGVNKIARWDGQQWHDVGGGVTGPFFPMVFSLASIKGRLIVGGFFATAGPTPASNIAAWDGESWTALAEGRAGSVDALAEYQGNIIAGGSAPIARWDGESWLPLGSGVDQNVRALTVYNNELVAAGFFHTAGGQTAHLIARWNGSQWSPLDTGVANAAFGAGNVTALAVFQDRLSVGGFFDTAGGLPSVNHARWNCPTACYPNCDNSTATPTLNANDFLCFLTSFAAQDPYANCDNSTTTPTLNANDFLCFLTSFAAGCP